MKKKNQLDSAVASKGLLQCASLFSWSSCVDLLCETAAELQQHASDEH